MYCKIFNEYLAFCVYVSGSSEEETRRYALTRYVYTYIYNISPSYVRRCICVLYSYVSISLSTNLSIYKYISIFKSIYLYVFVYHIVILLTNRLSIITLSRHHKLTNRRPGSYGVPDWLASDEWRHRTCWPHLHTSLVNPSTN